MTLAARLARQTGATVLLAWCERLPRGAGYVVRVVEPAHPLPDVPVAPVTPAAPGSGRDEVAAAAPAANDPQAEAAWLQAAVTAINRSMEVLIRQAPGQYLWGYHRHKRPRGMPAHEPVPALASLTASDETAETVATPPAAAATGDATAATETEAAPDATTDAATEATTDATLVASSPSR
jgi:hypothetical protein